MPVELMVGKRSSTTTDPPSINLMKDPLLGHLNKTGSVLIRNIEARSRNHRCRVKSTYYIFWAIFVALCIYHAARMRRIILLVAWQALTIFPHITTQTAPTELSEILNL
jgi:hypothetical protein